MPRILTKRTVILFYEYTTWRLATWETVYSAYMKGLVREDVMLGWMRIIVFSS